MSLVSRFSFDAHNKYSGSPETAAVENQVVQDVGCDQARVRLIQGTGLFVTVVNPPWSICPRTHLKKKMRQAAMTAYFAYPLHQQLVNVAVNYVKQTDWIIIPAIPHFVTSGFFTPQELQPPDPSATPSTDPISMPGT